MLNKAKALDLGRSWADAGWDVAFYPSGLSSRSRQYVAPVLVATRDGWTRHVNRWGRLEEIDPNGDVTTLTLECAK